MRRMLTLYVTIVVLMLIAQNPYLAAQSSTDMEFYLDRPGLDYRNFALAEARPELCQQACANEGQCRAYTYVKPGLQGPQAHCWLKSSVPSPVPNPCCVSGVPNVHVGIPPTFLPLDVEVDRPGLDYRNFALAEARPELCQQACANEGQCRAYTYVKPGLQGPQAHCWLKSSVPNPVPNACCVSAIRVVGAPLSAFPTIELDMDRPGLDYKNFALSIAHPGLCHSACGSDPACKAYTYVKPGLQGPQAHCWLKSGVPTPAPNPCCVSGMQGPAPFDLVWHAVDPNGLPLNPQWGWQITHPGELPDPRQLCNNEPDRHQCTTQATSRDSGLWCGPHVNWFPATYEGTIFWDSHSAPGTDDDYNFWLQRGDKAGLTTSDARGLQLEFDSDETIDHFHTPWWNDFHSAVDSNDASARQRVDGKFAIVTGLVGLDCEHSCGAEVHPVHALAIRVKEDPADEVWAIFVRNWGDEGFCSAGQHFLPLTSFTFRLPWRPGASSVSVKRFDRDFLTNDSNASGPNVTSSVNEGVLVHFTLSPPREDGTRTNGELHLQWSGAQIQPVQPLPQAVFAVPSAQPEEEDNAEHRLGDLLAQMTPQQRETFLMTLPKKTISYDEMVLPPSEARAVPHLPVLLPVQPAQPPRVQAGNAVEKAARERRMLDAWCTAFGGNVPGFPHACKDR